MTEAVGSSGLRAGLLERLFRRSDSDRNETVGADELAGLFADGNSNAAAGIIEANDKNGDGLLSLSEFSAAGLEPESMQGLLTVQEYKDATRAERQADDQAVIDAMFARADVDGDGSLSREEFDAERALQFASTLDAGAEVPQHMFAAMQTAFEDGQISRDEIMLGRRLTDVADAISLDDPTIDPELRARLERVRTLEPPPDGQDSEPAPPRPDTATVMRDAVSAATLTEALITRLLKQLEASAAAVGSGHSLDEQA